MVVFTKSRARKNLAEGRMTISFGKNALDETKYAISAPSRSTDILEYSLHKIILNRNEALQFVAMVAGNETLPKESWHDERSLSEKLRALADKLERH